MTNRAYELEDTKTSSLSTESEHRYNDPPCQEAYRSPPPPSPKLLSRSTRQPVNLRPSKSSFTQPRQLRPYSNRITCPPPPISSTMGDPREPSSAYRVTPHLKYNTVGGVNGPLVILENVRVLLSLGVNPLQRICSSVDKRARSNSQNTTRLSA